MARDKARIEKDQSLKHKLKIFRWRSRRALAAVRWGSGELSRTPAVLGNAMPKSGSHLIIQVLQGLTKIGPFVNPGFPPVNRTEDNRHLSIEGVLANIANMQPGDIGYGYLNATQSFIQALTQPGMASVFIYRDPRDMIVSHVFYATEMYPEHGMHDYYREKTKSMEERIDAAIIGVNEHNTTMRGVNERYQAYMGWLSIPEVLSLRFEELIQDQENAFNLLLDYLEEKGFDPKIARQTAIEQLATAIVPRKSGTFRRGKPGNWKEYFTDGNIKHFKESTGNLLVKLGYERNSDW